MTTILTSEQWLADWRTWHAEREDAVVAPHGIASNTGTTWLSDDPAIVDGLPGEWVVRDGHAANDELGLSLAPGEAHPYGDKLVKVIAPRPGTIAVRVFDPQAPTRVGLTGVDAFEPDPAWIVRGRFEPAAGDSTIAIQHADGVTTDDRLAGTVDAEISGEQVRLAVWPASEPATFEFTFTDATNGVTTKQFRFLKFAAPQADGEVELDFNRAFLPPCALGEGYLCPIPPAQNRLSFPVEAGEQFPRVDGTGEQNYIAGHLRDGGHAPGGVRDSADVKVHQHRLPHSYETFAALPAAEPAQIAAVTQTLSLYGHAVDNGDTELLSLVFAPGAEQPEVSTADRPLPSHHTVNTQVRRDGAALVAWSRLVTIAGDGSVATADAIDRLENTADGWRVVRRTLHPRHGGAQAVVDGATPW